MVTQYGTGGKSHDTTYIPLTGNPGPTFVWESAAFPQGMTLGQSYPNPIGGAPGSNARAVIDFYAEHFIQSAALNVYDMRGALVASLYRGALDAGAHRVLFTPGALAAGTYVYVLETNEGAIARMLNVAR